MKIQIVTQSQSKGQYDDTIRTQYGRAMQRSDRFIYHAKTQVEKPTCLFEIYSKGFTKRFVYYKSMSQK